MTQSDVTCDKLDGMSGWRHFPGWTVLFDPLPAPAAEVFRQPDESPNRAFVDALAEASDAVVARLHRLGVFVALPPDTFHLTLCDGVNAQTVRRADRAIATDWVSYAAAADIDRALRELLEAARRPLSFSTASIEVRGHAVVAALRPSDQAPYRLTSARAQLLSAVGASAGVNVDATWRPHITLGYVANRASVVEVRTRLASIWQRADSSLRNGLLMYSVEGASVYEFSDMATFWRTARM